MSVFPVLALSMLIATFAAAPTSAHAESTALPAGDSAAWRSAMLGWSAEPVEPASAPPFLMEKPVAIGRLSSRFGDRVDPVTGIWRAHRGVDIAAPAGTPIVASSDGIVTLAGRVGGYGEMVQVDHPGGLQTRYGHLSRILVRSGDVVRRGHVIGMMGSTGHSTGNHLHYEIRMAGSAVDPTQSLPGAPLSLPVPDRTDAPVASRWRGWTIPADRLPAAF